MPYFQKLFAIFFILFLFACQPTEKPFVESLPPLPDADTYNANNQIKYLNELLNQDWADEKQKANLYALRAKVYLELGKENVALENIEQAIELNQAYSEKGEYFAILAEAYWMREEIKESLEASRKAISLGVEDLSVYRRLAQTSFREKKWEESLAAFENIHKRSPSDTESLLYQGLLWEIKEDTSKAMPFIRQTIKKDSSNQQAHTALIRIYNDYDLPKNAWKHAQVGLQSESPDALLLDEYANTWSKLGKRDSAIVWYRKALAQDSTLYQSALEVGIYLAEKKYYPVAADYLQKVVAHKPSHAIANNLLGFLYEYKLYQAGTKLERYNIAKTYYAAALEANPEKIEYRDASIRIVRKIEREEYKLTPEYKARMRQLELERERLQDSISSFYPSNLLR